MSSVQEGSWGDLLGGRNLFFAIALSGGVALHAINIYIATTVLPSVVNEIGGLELYAWNTTLFVVASILGSALTARLLALTGPRKAYSVAALLFIAGSLICALAQNMPVMLAGRALQGLGGGFLFALCYAMIYAVFDEKLWPRAMALISGMWGVATLLGPAAGGIFAEMNIWRAAFGVLIPVTLLYMLLVWLVFPKHKRDTAPPAGKLPLVQLLLLVAAVMAVSTGGMSSDVAVNVAGIGVAVVLVLLLIRREFTSEIRLLPRDALRLNSPLLALYITMGLLIIGMTSETFIPYFLQILHGQTPLISGYLAALMAAGWTVSEIWSSGWQGRGIKRAIAVGPMLVLVGMVVLALSTPRSAGGEWIVLSLIGLGLTLVGFGIGLGWPHLLTRILQVAPTDDQDAAATSITTVQLFATALGSAVAGMLANAGGLSMPGGTEGASSAAWLLFAVMAAAPLLSLLSAKRVISGFNAQRAG
ncbi:MFS transporter [Nissabacter sp. SGAir0207]|uniref:MFS transporter n=1 Tax=Nissabacter sp. SGAir0207 TaxID=2126321 RepID=UPI0010CD3FEF|nr:MFS transporter [Nissabacter sp. SGAir0207]QCR38455.1 MFS transporter [Nissabacter sp. SGAir0207]